MGPLGIPKDWLVWRGATRPRTPGLLRREMRPDDYGRLGELIRPRRRVEGQAPAVARLRDPRGAPTATNGCYGWLIWLNAVAPCVGPRSPSAGRRTAATSRTCPPTLQLLRPVRRARRPSSRAQDLVVVRPGRTAACAHRRHDWEHELYAKILGWITDQKACRRAGAEGQPAVRTPTTASSRPCSAPERVRPGSEPLTR